MAKGNLFLGMGRGKVGDVVFYRMNGQQMARVRNRTPKNPRSNEQLYQRAIISTVMKAYSAGKEIFDHSFQGYTVGEGCMRRFNSVNARILRSQLIDDMAKGRKGQEAVARFVAPRSLYPNANFGFQISEGTLNNNLFITKQHDTQPFHQIVIAGNSSQNQTKVVDYLSNLKVYAGDIFTLVQLTINLHDVTYQYIWANDPYANQYSCKFQWTRFEVKDNINDELTLADATFDDVFVITASNNYTSPFDGKTKFQPGGIITGTNLSNAVTVASAVIRSRDDVDLRSTEYLVLTNNPAYGITSDYVLTIWQEEVTKVGQSELILEGGDGPTVQPLSDISEDGIIIPAPVNENPVPITARHKGTRNNPR